MKDKLTSHTDFEILNDYLLLTCRDPLVFTMDHSGLREEFAKELARRQIIAPEVQQITVYQQPITRLLKFKINHQDADDWLEEHTSQIETKGFQITSYGDESVGLYDICYSLEGEFIFENAFHMNEFIGELQTAFEVICGDRPEIITYESVKAINEYELEMAKSEKEFLENKMEDSHGND